MRPPSGLAEPRTRVGSRSWQIVKEMSGTRDGTGKRTERRDARRFISPEAGIAAQRPSHVPRLGRSGLDIGSIRMRGRNAMTSNSAGLDLQTAVDRFCALEQRAAAISPSELYHAALSHLHDICSAVLQCEAAGLTRDSIVASLAAARRIHARSPFVRRLQDWPRGYPGDFETVAQIVRGAQEASQSTLAATCEAYSLNFPIAQQHRNKIHHQSQRLLAAMMRKPRAARILALAC